MGHIIGYARVSTTRQAEQGSSLDSQEKELNAAGANRVFIDEGVSGAKASRPELDKMLDHLRDGDTLLVTRLDRLGRSMQHLVQLVADLKERGIAFRSLQEGIDTSNINGQLVFNIFASLAEFERALINERTSKGREAMRARGKTGGRPRTYDAKKVANVKLDHESGRFSPKEIAERNGVSVSTMYRLLRMEEPTA